MFGKHIDKKGSMQTNEKYDFEAQRYALNFFEVW